MTEPTKTESEAIAEILKIMEQWGISPDELTPIYAQETPTMETVGDIQ